MEETSPRLEGLLFPSIADVSVLSLDVSHEAICIDVCSTAVGAACPDCGSESTRVHSSYLRFPADVPSGDVSWSYNCEFGVSSAQRLRVLGGRSPSRCRD